MLTKLFEIRDSATFIPVMATTMDAHENQAQSWLLRRAGFVDVSDPSIRYILLCRFFGGRGECYCDPHSWSGRTMVTAHEYIIRHWNQLEDGDVIDVEFILGETRVRKSSEKLSSIG